MTDEDGVRACELEEEYAELGGWEAESDASRILQGLGVRWSYQTQMADGPRMSESETCWPRLCSAVPTCCC